MERPRPSSVAWGVLAAGVAAYDVLSPPGETLSERVDDWLEKPLSRSLAIGAIGVTALHLANALPQRFDPFHRLTTIKNTREPRPY
ncbi:hypothetical protein I8H89_00260 [Candidatus Saccharibacteria bacterium]|nr:hypothetical protein [Candidatus Saccharibacteria bacterium]